MRGVAMLGALVELQRAGWFVGVERFAGTSVGAVLAALLAIRMDDLENIFKRHVVGYTYNARIDLGSLDRSFGLDTGEGLQQWIDVILREPLTFQDVKTQYGSTLLVCATNLNTKRAVVFGPETHPDMDVGTALRMSCSVPLYFAAKTWRGELYVDGALSDNFPVEAAAGNGCRVLGVRCKTCPKEADAAWTLDSFLGALVEVATTRETPNGVDAVVLELEVGSGTQPLNFKMGSKELMVLYESGRTQGKGFVTSYTKKYE